MLPTFYKAKANRVNEEFNGWRRALLFDGELFRTAAVVSGVLRKRGITPAHRKLSPQARMKSTSTIRLEWLLTWIGISYFGFHIGS